MNTFRAALELARRWRKRRSGTSRFPCPFRRSSSPRGRWLLLRSEAARADISPGDPVSGLAAICRNAAADGRVLQGEPPVSGADKQDRAIGSPVGCWVRVRRGSGTFGVSLAMLKRERRSGVPAGATGDVQTGFREPRGEGQRSEDVELDLVQHTVRNV
jgi:hypothetical protein